MDPNYSKILNIAIEAEMQKIPDYMLEILV